MLDLELFLMFADVWEVYGLPHSYLSWYPHSLIHSLVYSFIHTFVYSCICYMWHTDSHVAPRESCFLVFTHGWGRTYDLLLTVDYSRGDEMSLLWLVYKIKTLSCWKTQPRDWPCQLDEVSSHVGEAYIARDCGQLPANSQEEAGILGLSAATKWILPRMWVSLEGVPSPVEPPDGSIVQKTPWLQSCDTVSRRAI